MKRRKHSLNPRAAIVPRVAAVYVRTSMDQTECSIEHQLQAIRHFAKQHGLDLVQIFQESDGPTDAAAERQ
jgi:hypothetical protein